MYKPQIGTEILKRDQLYQTEIAIASCGHYQYHLQIDLKLKRSNVFVYIFETLELVVLYLILIFKESFSQLHIILSIKDDNTTKMAFFVEEESIPQIN